MKRNFNEIYQEIYTNGIEEITKLKNDRNMSLFIFLALLGSVIVLYIKFMSNWKLLAICVCIAIISLVNLIKKDSEYRNGFKKLIIRRMIYLYNPEFKFYEKCGISSKEYREAFFDNAYDKFYSEDLIEGMIKEQYAFKMSQVKTQKERWVTDSEGRRRVETVVVFQGIFGVVNIDDNMLMRMDIMSNNFLNKYNKHRIEVDSGEFEKKYDMFSTDKVRAMEIFTSEIIEEFNNFFEDTGYVMQIKVDLNKLFFRISCGDAFEAPALKDALSYGYLYKNFKLIDFPINIISKMLENAIDTRR